MCRHHVPARCLAAPTDCFSTRRFLPGRYAPDRKLPLRSASCLVEKYKSAASEFARAPGHKRHSKLELDPADSAVRGLLNGRELRHSRSRDPVKHAQGVTERTLARSLSTCLNSSLRLRLLQNRRLSFSLSVQIQRIYLLTAQTSSPSSLASAASSLSSSHH